MRELFKISINISSFNKRLTDSFTFYIIIKPNFTIS